MCGGGSKPSGSKSADRRHREQMAAQREQMAQQQRQFDEQMAASQKRYDEQKALAERPAPPAPSPTAEAPAAALEIATTKPSTSFTSGIADLIAAA